MNGEDGERILLVEPRFPILKWDNLSILLGWKEDRDVLDVLSVELYHGTYFQALSAVVAFTHASFVYPFYHCKCSLGWTRLDRTPCSKTLFLSTVDHLGAVGNNITSPSSMVTPIVLSRIFFFLQSAVRRRSLFEVLILPTQHTQVCIGPSSSRRMLWSISYSLLSTEETNSELTSGTAFLFSRKKGRLLPRCS